MEAPPFRLIMMFEIARFAHVNEAILLYHIRIMKQIDMHIRQLKFKLSTAENLMEILTYFFDHLAENDKFMERGQHKSNNLLQTVLKSVAIEVLPIDKDNIVIIPMFKYLKKHKFYHGPCQINGYTSTILYFRDIDMGLIAFARMGSGNVPITRFSCRRMSHPPTFPN